MTSHYLAEPSELNHTLLHDAEMKCLKVIHDLGPLQMHHLAGYLHATKARASQLVSALESHGYVERNTGEDHRVKIVQVTHKGTTIVTTVRAKYQRLAEAIELRLGTEKTDQLHSLLQEITPLGQLTK